MKKELFISILFFVGLTSCGDQQQEQEAQSLIGNKNSDDLEETFVSLSTANISGIVKSSSGFGKKVGLYSELIDLFNPENFTCGCDDRMKRALQKMKTRGQSLEGFVPEVVSKNAFYADSVYLLDREGGNVLAHLINYKRQDGDTSGSIFVRNAFSTKNFSEGLYIEKNPSTYNNFVYTLDCKGFLTAAVSAAGGLTTNSIKTSASAAATINKSLFVIGGVMYSPLYQAFKGEGLFSGNDSATIARRINVLTAILSEIPASDLLDNTEIFINSNYEVILTSNSGTSGFNGEGKLEAAGGIGVGFGSVSGSASASGSIIRKSEYASYKTYIVRHNVNTVVTAITVKNLKDVIESLRATGNINS